MQILAKHIHRTMTQGLLLNYCADAYYDLHGYCCCFVCVCAMNPIRSQWIPSVFVYPLLFLFLSSYLALFRLLLWPTLSRLPLSSLPSPFQSIPAVSSLCDSLIQSTSQHASSVVAGDEKREGGREEWGREWGWIKRKRNFWDWGTEEGISCELEEEEGKRGRVKESIT